VTLPNDLYVTAHPERDLTSRSESKLSANSVELSDWTNYAMTTNVRTITSL